MVVSAGEGQGATREGAQAPEVCVSSVIPGGPMDAPGGLEPEQRPGGSAGTQSRDRGGAGRRVEGSREIVGRLLRGPRREMMGLGWGRQEGGEKETDQVC